MDGEGGRRSLITAALVAPIASASRHVGYAIGAIMVALIAYPKLNKPKDQ